MKIIAAIVDEKPEKCEECYLLGQFSRFCNLTRLQVYSYAGGRPDTCPLMTVDEYDGNEEFGA